MQGEHPIKARTGFSFNLIMSTILFPKLGEIFNHQ